MKRGIGVTTNALIVHLDHGKPVTDSLTIAREFGRRHDNVLQSLDNLIFGNTIGRLDFKESSYFNEQRKKQRMIELTERGALIAMPFIGGKNARKGQVRLVDAFYALRDIITSDWQLSRKQAAFTYRMMSDALHMTRADDGKATQSHHYSNEAKLINGAMFGTSKPASRDTLSSAELRRLELIEGRNAFLIARGRSYQERKATLAIFAQSLGCTPEATNHRLS